jgi:adenylosuccinate synthase
MAAPRRAAIFLGSRGRNARPAGPRRIREQPSFRELAYVVLPDGRHHTFLQFRAGTFVPGVHTLLASPVVVHPTALLVEAGFLRRAGVADALSRLTIAAACRVMTPYHQSAGRLRERLRGAGALGSCGVGVGETVAHRLIRTRRCTTPSSRARARRARSWRPSAARSRRSWT